MKTPTRAKPKIMQEYDLSTLPKEKVTDPMGRSLRRILRQETLRTVVVCYLAIVQTFLALHIVGVF